MVTKSQNRMASIRHKQGQSGTAVVADKTNSAMVKCSLKILVLKLKI